MAEFVVDRIGEAEGFDFFYKQSYILSKKAKGLPSLFAGADVYKFECSQSRRRTTKDSVAPYGKMRNRRGHVVLVDRPTTTKRRRLSTVCFMPHQRPGHLLD